MTSVLLLLDFTLRPDTAGGVLRLLEVGDSSGEALGVTLGVVAAGPGVAEMLGSPCEETLGDDTGAGTAVSMLCPREKYTPKAPTSPRVSKTPVCTFERFIQHLA